MIADVLGVTARACQAVCVVTWTPLREPSHFLLSLLVIAPPLSVPVSSQETVYVWRDGQMREAKLRPIGRRGRKNHKLDFIF